MTALGVEAKDLKCGADVPVPALYPDRADFEHALARRFPKLGIRAGALTVPHHLAAAQLISAGFQAIDLGEVDKVVVLSPDHFKRSRHPFATTGRSFDTVLGIICSSQADVARLLANSDLVEDSDLFLREHGVGAILPFIRHFLPRATIVPITVSITSRRDDWDQILALLKPIITDRTLVIQSTDFSHYLPFSEAVQRDQVTLNLLAAGDAEAIGRLRQPQHLDSPGSEYIVMRLQEIRGAPPPIVLYNQNSQSFSDEFEPETTSYVVQIHSRERINYVLPPLPGSRVICFGGDVFVGRFFAKASSQADFTNGIVQKARDILQGCPLVVNLEGAFGAPRKPVSSDLRLAMRTGPALRWLKRLGVTAVSLANNHTYDLGESGFAQTVRALRISGIRALVEGQITDLGGVRVVALSDLDNTRRPHTHRISAVDLTRIAHSSARPPLLAFLHWGEEWQPEPGPRERSLAAALTQAAVQTIIGAHAHVSQNHLRTLSGGDALLAYSLGNFLFDQRERASGVLFELRVFDQGTVFGRLLQIPNFYDEASKRQRH